MTKKDFFILLIKLFGLYSLIINVFTYLPNSIHILIPSPSAEGYFVFLFGLLLTVVLWVFLIFKSDKIVSLLKLDKGFDDDKIVIGETWAKDIVKIGCFIVGGFLIIDNIPIFLSHTLFALKVDVSGYAIPNDDYFGWFKTGLNLVIGILLVTNFNSIAKLLKVGK